MLSWRRTLRRRMDAWIDRRLPASDSVTLNQSRVFILPSRQGMALLLVAAVILLLAINFESTLNYALGFWLVAMLWAAVHLTYRNLSGLSIRSDHAALVQAGDDADYQLRFDSDSDRYRGPLELIHPDWGVISVVMDGQGAAVALSRPTRHRGRQPLPRFRLESRYPFGLIVAWSYILIDLSAWAYPAPVEQDPSRGTGRDEGQAADDHFIQSGSEDFHALREYQTGDAMHRIHWPSFARDQLVVKSFVEYQAADEWLEWQAYPGLTAENRLAALSFRIDHCLATNRPFGLRLPGVEITPGKGPGHTDNCRRALAEFGEAR